MTTKQVIRLLRADGWYEAGQNGSHLQLEHPFKPGKITVPMHSGKDLPPGTLNSVLKQAG